MRVITGDETGLVKVVRPESGECLAVAGQQGRARGVGGLCWSLNDSASRFHVARADGVVDVWDVNDSAVGGRGVPGCTLSLNMALTAPLGVIGVSCVLAGGVGGDTSLVSCNADGAVHFCKAGLEASAEPPTKFSVKGPVSAFCVLGTAAGAEMAVGGKENDLKKWDLATQQCTWRAKNVPHDFLELRQPVWVSAVKPLVPDEGLSQLVTGTAHRQVRLYDVRARRSPVHSADAGEHSITALAVAPGGREAIVADMAGRVRTLDLQTLRWGRRFVGPGGSVRDLAFHPSLPVLALVGLDRMVRVYDARTATPRFKVYLKQRLSRVLFAEEGEVPAAAAAGCRVDGGDTSDDEGVGWGSGEEYNMSDGSSEEEEEEEEEEGGGEEEEEEEEESEEEGKYEGGDSTSSEDDGHGSSESSGAEDSSGEGNGQANGHTGPPRGARATHSARAAGRRSGARGEALAKRDTPPPRPTGGKRFKKTR